MAARTRWSSSAMISLRGRHLQTAAACCANYSGAGNLISCKIALGSEENGKQHCRI